MNYIKSSEFTDVLSKYCKLDERRQIKYICPTVIGQLAEELELFCIRKNSFNITKKGV